MTAPTPSALRLIQGKESAAKINKDEPRPEIRKECPEPPDYLSADAKTYWRKHAPKLHGIGLLTEADETEFEALCEVYARWREACRQIEEFGMLIKTPNGMPCQSPYVQIATKSFEQMQKCLVQFGMTPSSRTRIRGEK